MLFQNWEILWYVVCFASEKWKPTTYTVLHAINDSTAFSNNMLRSAQFYLLSEIVAPPPTLSGQG